MIILNFFSFALPIICKNDAAKTHYFKQFSGAGIEIRPMISGNIQLQPFFKKYVSSFQVCESANFLHKNSFYCGNYPELTLTDLEVIKAHLINIRYLLSYRSSKKR